MMIDNVKSIVCFNMNKKKYFRYNGIRNQIEEFSGIITDMYPAVFVIKIDNGSIRSFSYTDLLIGNLEIME